MKRELTHDDKRRAFMGATCSMMGAADRWQERASTGLTDEHLAEALAYELGIAGGRSSHNDCPALTYQGAGLKIWAGWEWPNHVFAKPIFQGPSTVAMARQVYGIRNPGDRQLDLL